MNDRAKPCSAVIDLQFDLETQETTRVLEAISGRSIPGLGLAVSGDERVLLFGKIDRGDGDILLVEELSTGG